MHNVRNSLRFYEKRPLLPYLYRTIATRISAKSSNFQLERITKDTNFRLEHIRKYAIAGETPACWNCKKTSARKNHMICSSCGHLQDVEAEINFFDLLKFPTTFKLESQDLTKSFRQLQTIVHPDKFSNKTEREQANSADWSALINRAYKTLAVPIERGQYMLKLKGHELPQDNSALDKEFLMEMMERNEEVEEARTAADLQRLNERIVDELNEKSQTLRKEFELNALNRVKSVLVEMKYLLSIQKTIKNKMQALMIND